jgi:hypothetical protein
MKYKILKAQVEKVLSKYEKARNSDKWLVYKLYCDEYSSKVGLVNGKKAIAFEDLMILPDEQTITRIRRKFNQGTYDKYGNQITPPMYLATDPEVIKARAKKTKKLKKFINKFYEKCQKN